MDYIRLTKTFPATPEVLYTAWLDGKARSKMTGAKAKINPKVNGKFSAWDGYISGSTVDLIPNERIVQKWRTTDFAAEAPDSILEVRFLEGKSGTQLMLLHKNIPDGQGDSYKKGWREYYFEPMLKYFNSLL